MRCLVAVTLHIRGNLFSKERIITYRFNWASKKLDSRLRQLGAQSFSSRGEGDEQHPDG